MIIRGGTDFQICFLDAAKISRFASVNLTEIVQSQWKYISNEQTMALRSSGHEERKSAP